MADSLDQVLGGFTHEFAAKALLTYGFAELFASFRRRVRPIILERLIFGSEFIFVDIAVLDDEGCDPFRCLYGKTKPDLGAVIMQVESIALGSSPP